MKRKIWKSLLYIFSFLAILIVIILFVSLRKVDKTPYFETEYYSKTITDLNTALRESTETNGIFNAGFGKANITPSITSGEEDPENGVFNAVPLAGYSDSGKSATGVHDSIFVKAVAIKVNNKLVVMVGSDILLMPPEVADHVADMLKSTGLSREQIFFGATHTHQSLGSWSPGFVGETSAGKYQPEIVSWLSVKVKDAILAAISDIQLAKVGSSSLHAPDFIRNRMVDNGRLNDQLDFISIEQINGRKAIIGSYAAHATVLGASNEEFSGDYPGYFQRKLEEETVDLALFFAGSVGSHTNTGKSSGFEKAQIIGESLADSIIQNLSNVELISNATFSNISSTVQTPKLQLIRITKNIRLSQKIAEMLLPKVEKTYVQAIKLNNLVWITQPCELSGECALDLKNALAAKGYNSMITSFNGQYLGYVVPRKYYYFDTYETSLMSWYGPSMADYVMELNYTICNSLTGTKL
jgi:neutral ceramidase